jgi:uncharacterized membrane protein YdjX (TVP38/TMEM64 family)
MLTLRPATRIWLRRGFVIVLWLTVAIAWLRYQRAEGLSFTEAAQRFIDAAGGAWWAIPAFIGVFQLRPLVLFPPALLAVSAGVLFGPWVGIAVVLVGLNLSGTVAWAIGRSLSGPGAGRAGASGGMRRWVGRLHDNALQTVLVMRLVMIPYDVVNYLCGYLRVPWGPFVVGTAIGVIPSTVAMVLAGASVDRLDEGLSGVDPRLLVGSVGLVAVSLLVAWAVKRRQGLTGSVAETGGAS